MMVMEVIMMMVMVMIMMTRKTITRMMRSLSSSTMRLMVMNINKVEDDEVGADCHNDFCKMWTFMMIFFHAGFTTRIAWDSSQQVATQMYYFEKTLSNCGINFIHQLTC